jgi:hypothetical protein
MWWAITSLSIDPARAGLTVVRARDYPRAMWHQHRSPVAVVREWRLPAPERRAARCERHAEAQLRRERDSEWTRERHAAAVEAERHRCAFLGPW